MNKNSKLKTTQDIFLLCWHILPSILIEENVEY